MKYVAEHVFSKETKDTFHNSIQQLKEISERSPDGNKPPKAKLIIDVYHLFQKESNNQYVDLISNFSQRDVRILVWALDYQPENGSEIILFSNKLEIALRIINDKWKDSFIIGLWHIILKNWNNLLAADNQLSIVNEFLKTKCNEYDKSRKDILNAVSNIDLFLIKDSAREYASRLIKQKIMFDEAHKLINQKDFILWYEYFSSVLEEYIELIDTNSITIETCSAVYEFLRIHNDKKVNLIACSKILNTNKFDQFIEIIKNQTVLLVGDPIKDHLWRFNGLSTNQEESIASAKKRLNTLLNQHFIKIFFEKLVQDERRKKYWLKFINNIDDIKFVGSKSNYLLLKNVESVSEFVDSRYKTTIRYTKTCALIIYAKNYVFVEFSDTGALNIYKRKNFRFNLNQVNDMDDFKIWSIHDYACKNSIFTGYYSLQEEGRITHIGHWENRVEGWMNKYFHHSVLDPNELANINYVKDNWEIQWETDTFYYSKRQLPGYKYDFSKNAFAKAK